MRWAKFCAALMCWSELRMPARTFRSGPTSVTARSCWGCGCSSGDLHGRVLRGAQYKEQKAAARFMGVSDIPVARSGELAPGAMKEVDLGGREVLLANLDDSYFAFSSQCPHEAADLKTGALE